MNARYVRRRDWKKAVSLVQDMDIDVHLDGRKVFSGSSSFPTFMQSIDLATKNDASIILAVLAHELGHCLIARREKNVAHAMFLHILYNLRGTMTKRQARALADEERLAWKIGFAWLRNNGLPVTERMEYVRRVMIRHGHPVLNAVLQSG